MIKLYTTVLCMFAYMTYSQCNTLVWSDEFNGNDLDANKWAFQNGNGCPDLCGWGNGELENYTNNSKNIRVANGILTIEAVKESSNGSSFTASKIRTLGLASWTYGRFEASMRLPLGKGLWPAFWMLSDNNNWPMTGEIDIMEYRGDLPKRTYSTLHYGSPWPNNQHDGDTYDHSQNLSDDFHVYAVEWEENELRFYFDNVLIKKETKNPNTLNPASSDNPWPWSTKFYFILNLAVGGGFTGNPSAADVQLTKPTFEVDYVRVYSGSSVASPSITGPSKVFANTINTYSVPSISGATYAWQAPTGSILSGNSSNSITSQWSAEGSTTLASTITYPASGPCANQKLNLSKKVNVYQDNCSFVYNDYENRAITSIGAHSGTLSITNNPKTNTVNNSTKALQYVRSNTTQYDVLFLDSALVASGAEFESGKYAFELDVYTSRAAGTPIEIQLASSSAWNDTWPTGRHSTYTATTTKSNQWETLRFTFNQAADPNRSQFDKLIDRIIVLFNPNSNTGDTYYMDNLKKVAVNTSNCNLTGVEDELMGQIKAYPLPFDEVLNIEIPVSLGMASITLKDTKGALIKHTNNSGNIQWDLSTLTKGIYVLEIQSQNATTFQKIIK